MYASPDPDLLDNLGNLGLISSMDNATFEALNGGVSSDIWHVKSDGRSFCVKRALAKLKVKADWFAPIERNLFEVAWLQVANEIVPGAAPKVLAHDKATMVCAMAYLEPATHSNWKSDLMAGRIDRNVASQVGARLGQIHSGTAGRDEIQPGLPDIEIFHAIRLEPYLEALATPHPDLKEQLFRLSERTRTIHLVMIHGDVSPKNILVGPSGPVFIDAECACIGDPAFDLAFCLNHFLLKCLWRPDMTNDYLDCFADMYASYMEMVTWESTDDIEARAASLLPGLFLARVDGKSPVEYIDSDRDRQKVRRCARQLLKYPPEQLSQVADAWRVELAQ